MFAKVFIQTHALIQVIMPAAVGTGLRHFPVISLNGPCHSLELHCSHRLACEVPRHRPERRQSNEVALEISCAVRCGDRNTIDIAFMGAQESGLVTAIKAFFVGVSGSTRTEYMRSAFDADKC